MPLGNYGVNLRAIDSIAVPALRRALKAGQIIVIDEIGPMEIASALFCQTVIEILDSQVVVVGTIAQRPNVFANQVRAHPCVHIKNVTLANRDQIPTQVVTELTQN